MANDLNAQRGTYVAHEWKDGIGELNKDFTPVTAEWLNHIEQGIQSNSQDLALLGNAWDSTNHRSNNFIDYNTDLNDCMEVGKVYRCPANVMVPTLKNCPTSVAFWMYVDSINPEEEYRTQIVVPYARNYVYIRNRDKFNQDQDWGWTEWQIYVSNVGMMNRYHIWHGDAQIGQNGYLGIGDTSEYEFIEILYCTNIHGIRRSQIIPNGQCIISSTDGDKTMYLMYQKGNGHDTSVISWSSGATDMIVSITDVFGHLHYETGV